jgi:hypothetical protein
MKTFNFPQFYLNVFCYYFKCSCSSFDKAIKLFTLSCLHPFKNNYMYRCNFISCIKILFGLGCRNINSCYDDIDCDVTYQKMKIQYMKCQPIVLNLINSTSISSTNNQCAIFYQMFLIFFSPTPIIEYEYV